MVSEETTGERALCPEAQDDCASGRVTAVGTLWSTSWKYVTMPNKYKNRIQTGQFPCGYWRAFHLHLIAKHFSELNFPLRLAKWLASDLPPAQPNEGLCKRPHTVASLTARENKCDDTHERPHRKFLGTDPVVLRELDFKLDEQISLLEGVAILWHSLRSHHPHRAWRSVENAHIQRILIPNHEKKKD